MGVRTHEEEAEKKAVEVDVTSFLDEIPFPGEKPRIIYGRQQ